MSPLFNVRVNKQEYDQWIAHLQSIGYTIDEVRKGGLMDSIQANVLNPDGTTNTDLAAMSIMDAEKGRRVYFLQIRVAAAVEERIPEVA